MSFEKIINQYRTNSNSLRNQGEKFERLMKDFILTAPEFKGDRIKNVWLWTEFPSKKDFGTGSDIGIDLVVHTEVGEYWAVQCKCYNKDKQIDKADVDTFLSTSAKVFHDINKTEEPVHFSRRLWLDTSGKGFSVNAENTIKGQTPPRYPYGVLRPIKCQC